MPRRVTEAEVYEAAKRAHVALEDAEVSQMASYLDDVLMSLEPLLEYAVESDSEYGADCALKGDAS